MATQAPINYSNDYLFKTMNLRGNIGILNTTVESRQRFLTILFVLQDNVPLSHTHIRRYSKLRCLRVHYNHRNTPVTCKYEIFSIEMYILEHAFCLFTLLNFLFPVINEKIQASWHEMFIIMPFSISVWF